MQDLYYAWCSDKNDPVTYCQLLLKTSQFKTVCKDDSGCITQLKQQKSKRWHYLAAHRQIVNVLTSNITFLIFFVAIWQHLGQFLAIFSLRMRRNGYIWTSGQNSDNTIRFLDSDFLIGHDISAIWGRLLLIFALDKLTVRHITTSGLVGLLI